MTTSLRKYIEDRCIPVPFVGCWMWLRSCGSHGYGQGSMQGNRVTTAHRISYLAFKGDIPDGMLVQHSCDNRWCVNPDHLSLGTDATNAIDKQLKGRAARKLTIEDAVRIKQRLSAGTPIRQLAREFGVCQRSVQFIARGRSWRHAGFYDASKEHTP